MNSALSSFGRARQKIFFYLLFTLVSISAIAFCLPTSGNNPTSIHDDCIGLPRKGISSEEENIDSFDVHPESLRWNTTLDDSIEDRADNSLFEILSVNNETSGSNGYEMNRGTVKTDGKLEWRMSSDGSGNQSEYSRDVLGDEWDFTEDNENWIGFSGGSAPNQENGILITSRGIPDSLWGISLEGLSNINTKVYHTINFKVRATGAVQTNLRFGFDDSGGTRRDIIVVAGNMETEWTEYSVDLSSDNGWVNSTDYVTAIMISVGTSSSGEIQFDYIKLIGDYDFATHIEGEIGDTWDWEDSNEYWYNEESNISDFNDGTVEDWIKGTGTSFVSNSNNELLIGEQGGGINYFEINTSGISVAAATYKFFCMEFSVDADPIDEIHFFDSANNLIASDATGWAEGGTEYLISKEFGADWTGTETDLQIRFYSNVSATSAAVRANFTFLYDISLGDIETFVGLNYKYANPNGFLTGMCDSGTSETFFTSQGLSISGEIFDYLEFKMKVSDSSMDFDLYAFDGSSGIRITPDDIDFDNKSWHIFKFNLVSEYSSWDEVVWEYIYLRLDESDGNLDGDEYLDMDYFLLLGEYNPSDSVIGLMDSIGTPLLNISTRFVGNNTGRFEFELMDETGELSYHWYSDYYADLDEFFVIGKCTFDILRSRLEITLTAENNSRIDKITFPNEFIKDSGLIPPLFSNVIAPYVFISTHTISHSWQKVFIDWIKADFKEREWIHVDIPSDSDYLTDNWYSAIVQDDIDDDSEYKLIVPYLDAVSASIILNLDDATNIVVNDVFTITYTIYAVDADDGGIHEALKFYLYMSDDGLGGEEWNIQLYEDGVLQWDHLEAAATGDEMRLDFSVTTDYDRTEMKAQVLYWFDNTHNMEDALDYSLQVDLSAVTADFSNEFVLDIDYSIDFDGNVLFGGFVNDHELIEKDLFSGLILAIVEPVQNFVTGIFTILFRFIASIFKGVGDVIGAAILILQGVLETAIGAVVTAVGDIATAVGDIATAIGELAGQIATAIWESIGDALDFIVEAVEGIFEFLVLALADIIDEIIIVLGNIISDIIGLIATIIFTIWNSIGLPDLFEVIDTFLSYLEEFIVWGLDTFAEMVQLVADLSWIILVIWWLWAIPLQWAKANFDPLGGISNFIDVFFYDAIPISIMGNNVYCPQGIIFTLWLILLLPNDFALFTAMGL